MMIMTNSKKLYAHQQRFLNKNPDKALLVHETGTGKTVTAICWMNLRPNAKMLVVCPKGIIEKWRRDIYGWGTERRVETDVVSRDGVKKINLNNYDGLIIDEAQDHASPLFDKSRSQRAGTIYNYVKKHPRAYILLLTATPVRSTPYNIHTLACYLGIYWDIKAFREEFFYFTDKYGRFHWEKKKGWQKAIRPYVEKISDIVLMSECTDVPRQNHQVINIKWTAEQEKELKNKGYMEPMAKWIARHRLEQGERKYKERKKLIDGYQKIIVVCHYKAQIADYVERIGDERLVYVLTGETKDQDMVIEEAKQAKDCVFFVQASMGAGFDASEFSVIVFASMSFRYVDLVQMRGRVKRINNLHENTFIYLLAGKNDEAVYTTLMAGQDFDPIHYLQNGITEFTPNKE